MWPTSEENQGALTHRGPQGGSIKTRNAGYVPGRNEASTPAGFCYLRRAAGTGLIALALASADVAYSDVHAPYRMLNSNLPADDLRPTLWIDNEQVLFTGIELGTYPCNVRQSRRCGSKGLIVGTHLWNTRSNILTRYRDLVISNPCTSGERISYTLRERVEDRVASVYAGRFGEEKRLGFIDEYPHHNPIDCTYHRQSPPDWIKRRGDYGRPWVRPLLDKHGWLEMDKESGASVIVGEKYAPRLVRADGDAGRVLDVDRVPSKTLSYGYNVNYLPFADKYLVSGISNSTSNLPPAWYLKPNGDVERIVVPLGPWNSAKYFGVRPGLFLVSGNAKGIDDPGYAGGYLVAGGSINKVASGNLRQLSVSPDGCRLAFIFSRSQKDQAAGYRAWKDGSPGNTLHMLDLCEGGRK